MIFNKAVVLVSLILASIQLVSTSADIGTPTDNSKPVQVDSTPFITQLFRSLSGYIPSLNTTTTSQSITINETNEGPKEDKFLLVNGDDEEYFEEVEDEEEVYEEEEEEEGIQSSTIHQRKFTKSFVDATKEGIIKEKLRKEADNPPVEPVPASISSFQSSSTFSSEPIESESPKGSLLEFDDDSVKEEASQPAKQEEVWQKVRTDKSVKPRDHDPSPTIIDYSHPNPYSLIEFEEEESEDSEEEEEEALTQLPVIDNTPPRSISMIISFDESPALIPKSPFNELRKRPYTPSSRTKSTEVAAFSETLTSAEDIAETGKVWRDVDPKERIKGIILIIFSIMGMMFLCFFDDRRRN